MDGLAQLLLSMGQPHTVPNDVVDREFSRRSPQSIKDKKAMKVRGFHKPADNITQDELLGMSLALPITDSLALTGDGFQGQFHNFKKLANDRFRQGSVGAAYDFGPGKAFGKFKKEQFNDYNPKSSREVGVKLDDIGKFAVEQNTRRPEDIDYKAETRIPLDSLAAMLKLKGSYNAMKDQPEFSAQFTKKF